jgi:hypothetical protein
MASETVSNTSRKSRFLFLQSACAREKEAEEAILTIQNSRSSSAQTRSHAHEDRDENLVFVILLLYLLLLLFRHHSLPLFDFRELLCQRLALRSISEASTRERRRNEPKLGRRSPIPPHNQTHTHTHTHRERDQEKEREQTSAVSFSMALSASSFVGSDCSRFSVSRNSFTSSCRPRSVASQREIQT